MSDLQTDFNMSKQSSERTNQYSANYKINTAVLLKKRLIKKQGKTIYMIDSNKNS